MLQQWLQGRLPASIGTETVSDNCLLCKAVACSMHSGAHLVAPHRTPLLLHMSHICYLTVYGPHIHACIEAMLSASSKIETISQHVHCSGLPWAVSCLDLDAVPDCLYGVRNGVLW